MSWGAGGAGHLVISEQPTIGSWCRGKSERRGTSAAFLGAPMGRRGVLPQPGTRSELWRRPSVLAASRKLVLYPASNWAEKVTYADTRPERNAVTTSRTTYVGNGQSLCKQS